MAKAPYSASAHLLVGDNLNFIAGPAPWSKRLMAQGTVVETSILGRTAYFIWGANAMKAFYDENNVVRSTLKSIMDPFLFNNQRNAVPVMDGQAHKVVKSILVSLHSPAHLETYLNEISALTEDFITELQSGLPKGVGSRPTTLHLFPKLQEFEARFMAKMFYSAEVDKTFQKEAHTFLDGIGSLPIPIPGFSHYNGLKATKYLLDFTRRQLAEHRANPTKYDDIMSTLMKRPELTDDDIVIDIHHSIFAMSNLPVALSMSLTGALRNPDVLAKIRAEIKRNIKVLQPGQHYNQKIIADKFAYTQNVVREALRYYAVVPLQMGNSVADFEVDGFRVPAGSLVIAGFYATNMDPKVFPEPNEFLPERFETIKNTEDSWSWASFGAGPPLQTHRCAGQATALAVTTYLLAKLLATFDFELVDKEQTLNYARVVPRPAGNLPVRLTAL